MTELDPVVDYRFQKSSRFHSDKRDAERQFLSYAVFSQGLIVTHRMAALKYEWQDQTHKLLFDALNHHVAQQQVGNEYGNSQTRKLAAENAIRNLAEAASIIPCKTDDTLVVEPCLRKLGWIVDPVIPTPKELPNYEVGENWERIHEYADCDGNAVVITFNQEKPKENGQLQSPGNETEKDRETGPEPNPDPANERAIDAVSEHADGDNS